MTKDLKTEELEIAETETSKNKSQGVHKVLKIAGNIIWGIILTFGIITAFFLAQYKLTGGPPQLFGQQMYIVLSGSMEPTFSSRSLIFVKPLEPAKVKEGDIITFTGQGENSGLTTHRVVAITHEEGQISFITKGDANEANDPYPVSGDKLVGKVSIAIPYLGAVMSFAQTKYGLLAFIIGPGLLLILLEIYKLYENIIQMSKEKKEKTEAGV
ncbi:MAG: signal peptidase I [Desulfitobacteriia bacterium]